MLALDGYAVLRAVAGPVTIGALRDAIARIGASGLPFVFVCAFDELWTLGESLAARVSKVLGHPYELLADAWAWAIPPGRHGWPPHRGGDATPLTRDAPEVLTVWVALTDAPADRACMHVIPLDDDPNYPAHLERLDAPLSAVRALPVAAGTALVWNANILHWGGSSSPRAPGPRISCSFSLGRSDTPSRHGVPTLRAPSKLDVFARLDVIASQIQTYGPGQPDVTPDILEWARATCSLRAAIDHFDARIGSRKEG